MRLAIYFKTSELRIVLFAFQNHPDHPLKAFQRLIRAYHLMNADRKFNIINGKTNPEKTDNGCGCAGENETKTESI